MEQTDWERDYLITYVPVLKFQKKADFISYNAGGKIHKFSSLSMWRALARNIRLRDVPTCSCIQLYTQCSGYPTIWICAQKKKEKKQKQNNFFLKKQKQKQKTKQKQKQNKNKTKQNKQTKKSGGYSDLGWVRMCGPEFQLLPYSKTWPLANLQPISKPHFLQGPM